LRYFQTPLLLWIGSGCVPCFAVSSLPIPISLSHTWWTSIVWLLLLLQAKGLVIGPHA
jgi:hypothetical protein